MDDKPLKVCGYARVSTREQTEKGYSLRQQADRLRDWCDEQGHELVEVVEERGVSGTVLDRPGLGRVLDLVTGGEVDLVVAQDMDRVSREPWHFGYLLAKLQESGAGLRTLDDRGDDSPEGEFFRDIRKSMAKMERQMTALRTRRGRERRAREGKVVPGGSPPLGFGFTDNRTNFVVDEERAAVVRRVFRLIAEGATIRSVKLTLEREDVPTPKAKRFWTRPVIRDALFNDAYRPHGRAELEALVERGVLAREVLDRLDGERSYGIWWYGKDKTTRTGKLTDSGGPARRFSHRPQDEMIAVPVPDLGVPVEHVERAREAVRHNRSPSSAGHRVWELSGGVGFCACRRRLSTHRTKRPHGTYHNYVCSKTRQHGAGACEHGRYHKAEATEERVRDFVRGLLRNPEVLREKVLEGIRREQAGLGAVTEEAKHLHRELEAAKEERRGYLRQNARGALPDEELDGMLAEAAEHIRELEEELGALGARREQARTLEQREAMVESYLRDLTYLADRTPVVREYETVLTPRAQENPLGLHMLTTEGFRHLPDEELAAERRRVADDRARRWQELYMMLGLTVTMHQDGTLVLRWGGGEARRALAPEPRLEHPLDPAQTAPALPDVLPNESDSQR